MLPVILGTDKYKKKLTELSFFIGSGASVGGDQNCLRSPKGGTSFFSGPEEVFFHTRGDQHFFTKPKGPEFSHKAKGGDKNISPRQRGTRIFYACKGGDRNKLVTGHHPSFKKVSWPILSPFE